MESSTTIALREQLTATRLQHLHHDRGLGVREMAVELDVSVTTIYRSMIRHNIELCSHGFENRKPHLAELLTKDHLQQLLDDQLTVAQIAGRHDCSIQTIYTYLKKHGLELSVRAPRTIRPSGLTVEHVTALYHQDGFSQSAIAAQIGVSPKTVSAFMANNGIESRRPRHELDDETVAAAYRAGATQGELANQYGCSVWVITKHLDRAGVKRRPGKRSSRR